MEYSGKPTCDHHLNQSAALDHRHRVWRWIEKGKSGALNFFAATIIIYSNTDGGGGGSGVCVAGCESPPSYKIALARPYRLAILCCTTNCTERSSSSSSQRFSSQCSREMPQIDHLHLHCIIDQV